MPAIRQLDLIVPGLAGPASDHPVTDYLPARPQALDRLLSRSRSSTTGVMEPDDVLLQSCGMATGGGLPVASLSGLADLAGSEQYCLLRADPVHLRADQSSLRLFDANSFELSREEADALVASINDFNRERGWELLAPVPQRWYLRLPEPPALTTSSPFQVAGRNIDPYLPSGPDARHWRVIMNELQMLLYDHPVNRARLQRGQPAINSLWFWGGGLPQAARGTRPDAVFGSAALVIGLARHAGITHHGLPEHARTVLELASGAHVLVVLDALQWPACYNEMERWLETLAALETAWFRPLLDALAGGRLGALAIDGCSGRRFRTSRWQQRAFWQAVRPYEERLPA
jgi:hypothetical protein